MPVEIKELVIRVSVSEGAGAQGGQQGAAGQQSSGGGSESKEQIVAECVEQILEILKNKNER